MMRLGMSIATLALPAVLVCAACEDGTADPGAACAQSGGVCSGSDVTCGESLPYPCPNKETCCIPQAKPSPQPHDAGSD